ncbi:MAG: hypothetical protein ABIQ93_02790 [Saprospiraceae bacterium]
MPEIAPSSNRLPLAVSCLLALAILVYTGIRAVKVGFTHDEASSYMNLLHESVKDLFFNERNWRAANNHLINTLCMQVGDHFFGAEEWALRWASLVAGLLFLTYAFRTVRLWLPGNSWFFCGAFSIFVLNHFVIDFFSLARGYGFCLAFEMAGLYYFFRWLQEERRSDLPKAVCALCAGILANFILLDVLAAFFATATIAFYLKNDRRYSFPSWLRLMALPALPLLATALLIFQPMRWISAKGEFEYGPQGFWETWRVLVERFVYDPFPGQSWWKVLILVIATIGFLVLGYTIVRRFRRTGINSNPSLFYAGLFTVTTMFATVVQHYLLGANYLSGRTAVLFYPLLSSVVILYLIDLQKNIWPWVVVCGFMILNFCAQLNLRHALEWQYDENTAAALRLANQRSDPRHKLNYGLGWQYYSSTLFYQQTRRLYNVEIVAYNASHNDLDWVRNQPFDLIYIPVELSPKVEDQYFVLQRFPQGVMMQRRP